MNFSSNISLLIVRYKAFTCKIEWETGYGLYENSVNIYSCYKSHNKVYTRLIGKILQFELLERLRQEDSKFNI